MSKTYLIWNIINKARVPYLSIHRATMLKHTYLSIDAVQISTRIKQNYDRALPTYFEPGLDINKGERASFGAEADRFGDPFDVEFSYDKKS